MATILRIKEGDIGNDMLPVVSVEKGGTGADNEIDARQSLAGLAKGRSRGMPLTYGTLKDTELVVEPETTEVVCSCMLANQTVAFFMNADDDIYLTDCPFDSGYIILYKGFYEDYVGGVCFSIDGDTYTYRHSEGIETGRGWHKVYTELDKPGKPSETRKLQGYGYYYIQIMIQDKDNSEEAGLINVGLICWSNNTQHLEYDTYIFNCATSLESECHRYALWIRNSDGSLYLFDVDDYYEAVEESNVTFFVKKIGTF